jgi:YqxM protein
MKLQTAAVMLTLALSFGTGLISAGVRPTTVLAQVSDEWDQSSLKFTVDCVNQCGVATATVCNVGSQDMDGPVAWQLYYSADGNPKDGTVVASGEVPAMPSTDPDSCTTLSQAVSADGNYMYRVAQRPGHPGTAELWSTMCGAVCASPTPTPTPSPTPSADPSPTPVVTPDPSPTPTSTPVTSNSCARRSSLSASLSCENSRFGVEYRLTNADGQPQENVWIKFSYKGSTAEVKTDRNGVAQASFEKRGNDNVTAEPTDGGCPAQSLSISEPTNCPATGGAVQGATTTTSGQVLGASTLAATGTADQALAAMIMVAGLIITSAGVFGYAKTR